MKPFDLVSERFSPNGSFTASGALNALGRPDLGFMQLLIREMGQNSWDARYARSTVTFSVELSSATGQELRFLTSTVFRKRPPKLPLDQSLSRASATGRLPLLVISDRGTVGLGGPTRADRSGSPLNFVEFLRNYGQADNPHGSGGTYGFGKTAAYLASRAQTICVYTRWSPARGPESRFICSALGEMSGQFTGRHWWGREVDEVAEPLLDEDADEAAKALGLSVLRGKDTGTAIVVVDPHEDEETSFSEAAVNAILWNFWPKFSSTGRKTPEMVFRVAADGRDVPIPDPRTVAPLAAFVRAFELVTGPETLTEEPTIVVKAIDGEKPKRRLGRLAIIRSPALPSKIRGPNSPLGERSHHVALMRMPNLVVRYLPGPALDTDIAEYAGVFKIDRALEDIFAKAETPTHDNWSKEGLRDGSERRAISVSLTRVRAAMDSFALPALQVSDATAAEPLGRFSTDLGVLMTGAGASAASTPTTGKPPTAPRSPRRHRANADVHVVGASVPRMQDGRLIARVQFDVLGSADGRPTRVRGRAAACVDDGTLETELPAGETPPAIRKWLGPDGVSLSGDAIEVLPGDSSGWIIEVDALSDAQVGVELTAESF